MTPDKCAYRYRVVEAHGSPPAEYKKGAVVIEPDDYGNSDVLYDVKAGRVVWLAVLVFDGLVPRSALNA